MAKDFNLKVTDGKRVYLAICESLMAMKSVMVMESETEDIHDNGVLS